MKKKFVIKRLVDNNYWTGFGFLKYGGATKVYEDSSTPILEIQKDSRLDNTTIEEVWVLESSKE